MVPVSRHFSKSRWWHVPAIRTISQQEGDSRCPHFYNAGFLLDSVGVPPGHSEDGGIRGYEA